MEQSRQYQDTDIVRTLGLESRDRDRKRLKRWGFIAILGVLAVGVGIVVKNQILNARPSEFKTVKVQRGSLTVTATATGTLKPINQVNVGSELSGTVETVEVDYNDRVKQGQILWPGWTPMSSRPSSYNPRPRSNRSRPSYRWQGRLSGKPD